MNKRTYVSKKDSWVSILFWLVILPISVYSMVILPNLIMILTNILLILVISWFWFGTTYTLTDNNYLIMRCGPVRSKIEIAKIYKIKAAKNFLSSYALSSDRLEISLENSKWYSVWYISPKDKTGFIEEIKKRNPNIIFELNKTH